MIQVQLPKNQLLIEIWSDIVCPFCYVGKRHLEAALDNLRAEMALNGDAHKRPAQKSPEDELQVDLVWKSFELDPSSRSEHIPMVQVLAKKYGVSETQAFGMMDNVTQMATEAGLEYRIKETVAVNSFNAHRLLHAALGEGIQGRLQEALFDAYFCQALDLGDPQVLEQIAIRAGMDSQLVQEVLASDLWADEVRADEREAEDLGVRGVPFFVFNRKVAISGAQPVAAFEQALRKALAPARTQ